MRQLLVILVLSFFCSAAVYSQTAIIKGTVKDAANGDVLESATVIQPPTNGTTTDEKGNFELKVEPGNITLVITYMGLQTDTHYIKIGPNETKTLNIGLKGGKPNELQEVVIGADKVGVKLTKVTQTVDIIKPRMLETNNITNAQDAVAKITGVTVLDGQMSIRGGSGYAYGSGSRVILVVDEMPLMSADRGEIKWPMVPTENIAQMEVIKGASTVQYGSAALNGVLSVTTGYAVDTPSTKFTLFYQGMGKPPVDSFQWWKRGGKFLENPNTAGISFLHKQKFGDVDLVVGGMLNGSRSHLEQEYDDYTRFNIKLRYQPHKLKRLNIELSSLLLYRKDGFQFYWQDGGHPYLSASGVDLDERYFIAYVDPKFKFIDKGNNQHKLMTRYFRQNNLDGQTDFSVYTVDYQFRHDFGKIFRILTGVRNEHAIVKDGNLGTHKTDFGGGFLLGELDYKFMTLKAGVREEYVRLDSAITPTIPVFSAAVNFEARKYNYIRASFGQSFRVPSIAERFVTYNLAGIRILPNYDIQPEKGYTLELGYKRSIKIGNWLGYFDASTFWTEFRNMIEFTFGTRFDSSGFYPYFQSQNVSHARIFGWELSTYGEGKWGPVDFSMMLGYTYFYGVDLSDTTLTDRGRNIGGFLGDAFRNFVQPTPVDSLGNPSYEAWNERTNGMLKYRNPHQFKMDLDFILYNKYHLGTSLQFYSYMTRIDAIFEVFIKGTKDYRANRLNTGDVIWDLRAGYDFNRNISLNFVVKNVLNSNYAIRIARPNAPRTYTVQLIVNFGKGNGNARQPQNMTNSNM